jgi:hypothetical protein
LSYELTARSSRLKARGCNKLHIGKLEKLQEKK